MAKKIGFGTKIEFTVSTAFDTELGLVLSIEGPSATRADVDTTTLDNASEYRTFISGLADPGEITMEVALDPANATQQAITDLLDTGDETDWKITDGGAVVVLATFKAYVKSYAPSFPLDGMQTASITLKCSADPGWVT